MSDLSLQTEPLSYSLHLAEGINPALAFSVLSFILEGNELIDDAVIYQSKEDGDGVEVVRIGEDLYVDPVYI